jgi:hypothetical protein
VSLALSAFSSSGSTVRIWAASRLGASFFRPGTTALPTVRRSGPLTSSAPICRSISSAVPGPAGRVMRIETGSLAPVSDW